MGAKKDNLHLQVILVILMDYSKKHFRKFGIMMYLMPFFQAFRG